MSAADLPADPKLSAHEREGFAAFWRGVALDGLREWEDMDADNARGRGWWIANARAFGHGVKSWGLDKAGAEGVNPYERFSPAGEAWAAGYDEAVTL